MPELSVIIPFINEWPQVAFTIMSIAEELRDRVDFEIIVVDNWCAEVKAQNREPDRSHVQVESMAQFHPWLRLVKYDKKLSHWQAKNLGVRESLGRFLWFCDAHCIVSRNSVHDMFRYYRYHWAELNGSIHLPLTYHILEAHRLIYKLKAELENGFVGYSFTGFRESTMPYKVPCMSTCGMMVTRELYDLMDGWPEILGIYGGGENFWNFTQAILGKNVWIYPAHPLRHHGEKRGYHWNYDNMLTNRASAMYMIGGEKLARKYLNHCKGRPAVKDQIFLNVVISGEKQRAKIKANQVISIEDWVAKWE